MRFERRLRAMLGRLPVCLAIGLSVSNAASAFEPGDVFWVSGVCGTPCGVFDITAGGTIGAGDLVAAMQESPGQVAWSSDRQTLYVSEFGTDAILAISGSGAVTLFASQISGPTGLLRVADGRLLAVSYRDGAVYDASAGGDLSAAVPIATGFNAPRNLLQLSTGEILLADQGRNRVFDISGGGDFSSAAGFARGFSQGPYDLVESASGDIYASTFAGVFEISMGGDLSSASPYATGIQFIGLAIDGVGRMLASDFSSSDVYDISAGGDVSGATPFATGLPGLGDTALDSIPATSTPAGVPSSGAPAIGLLVALLCACALRGLRER